MVQQAHPPAEVAHDSCLDSPRIHSSGRNPCKKKGRRLLVCSSGGAQGLLPGIGGCAPPLLAVDRCPSTASYSPVSKELDLACTAPQGGRWDIKCQWGFKSVSLKLFWYLQATQKAKSRHISRSRHLFTVKTRRAHAHPVPCLSCHVTPHPQRRPKEPSREEAPAPALQSSPATHTLGDKGCAPV